MTTATLALLVVLSGSKVAAQPLIGPARQARIDGLVVRLGDPDFATREAAERDLLSLGMHAKSTVTRALQQSPDPEIRARCKRLLSRIDFNFCWERASRILGETPAARQQFVDMYGTERDLWYALAEGNPDLGKKYADRCKELAAGPPLRQAQFRAPSDAVDLSRYELREGRLATLLVIGAEFRTQIPKDTLQLVTPLFKQKWGGQYAKNTPPVLRKSYVTWAEEIAPLPIEYEGDKKLEAARTTLRSSIVSASDRQAALLTVAQAKDKRDDDLIRAFMTDEAVCDTLFSKGVKTQVQLRDIALAATIYRTGKDPSAFGFKNLKADPELLFRPSSLGFASADERAEAFRAWQEAVGMPR